MHPLPESCTSRAAVFRAGRRFCSSWAIRARATTRVRDMLDTGFAFPTGGWCCTFQSTLRALRPPALIQPYCSASGSNCRATLASAPLYCPIIELVGPSRLGAGWDRYD
ncbi:hypothetical protein MSAN_00634600 [Mycena sanguinolenta]|uniref:Uncharacterized protein n=1 Tax=Mycena sanguinolenta TaxID=230812 RepID=A0A8H7DG04_9AGAR|nr:hypothetical protein MSAN_00634600 [Mycena sanguinolenta]